ncbi:MAG: hypothetical protein ACLU30_06240 [Odoribacter splanchnicus]
MENVEEKSYLSSFVFVYFTLIPIVSRLEAAISSLDIDGPLAVLGDLAFETNISVVIGQLTQAVLERM